MSNLEPKESKKAASKTIVKLEKCSHSHDSSAHNHHGHGNQKREKCKNCCNQ